MIKKVLRPVKYILLMLVLMLAQCGDEKKPKGLLTQDQMVSLMVDVYLAEARLSAKGISRDSASKLFAPFEKKLLTQKGLTDSVLKANYTYYLERPKELEIILDAVIDTLSLREQRPDPQHQP